MLLFDTYWLTLVLLQPPQNIFRKGVTSFGCLNFNIILRSLSPIKGQLTKLLKETKNGTTPENKIIFYLSGS